jgi:hypothetical protein
MCPMWHLQSFFYFLPIGLILENHDACGKNRLMRVEEIVVFRLGTSLMISSTSLFLDDHRSCVLSSLVIKRHPSVNCVLFDSS